ncbi:DUF1648 domain-containing protein [Microbacterium deminutum]|uniref:DUF1648 domain-containing protein n=1 Tax=Microbacterium deminutum TaxID=344164 RepID=A0ABP5C6L7_9MICO
MTADQLHALAIRRFILVAIVIPLAIVVVGVVVQLLALPHVPATIAVHWDAAGRPNRFAPAWTQPLATIAFGAGIPLLIGLTALPGLRRGDRGATYRLMGAIAAATATLVTVMSTWTLVMQAGDAGGTAELSVWPALLAAFGAAVAVGVAGWFLQPAESRRASNAAAATPLAISPGERVVWLRTTSMVPAAAIAIALGVAVLAVAAFMAWLTGAADGLVWLLTGTALVLVILAATTVAFHVRVDDDGLTVRSVLGIPRFRVPLGEVSSAAEVEVNPMGEFGGWGLRLGADRRFGIILRAGDAIEVARTSGRRLVVTVDDAATGAGLLQALKARDAASRP